MTIQADSQDLTPHTVGAAIRLVRKEKAMTLAAVATRSGLSASYLSDIENNRTLPPLDTLGKIAMALDHNLLISMSEAHEMSFPCTANEAEMLYALRQKDFERFMLMATAILLGDQNAKGSDNASD